jgi:membrane protease YdiL (CAAX protease family)
MDRLAEQLRGFGLVGVAAIAFILAANFLFAPLGALMVLLWVWLSKTSWRDIGFSRPRRWPAVLIIGIAGGILLKLIQKAIVMPLLDAPAINPYFHFIAGNPSAMARMLVASVLIGGIGEEIFYRGYLFERLGRLWGHGNGAKTTMVLLTSALFAIVHYPEQGVAGAQQAAFTGLTFGTIYAVTGRLWLPMVVHSTYNITAVLMIYWGLETAVARSLFG